MAFDVLVGLVPVFFAVLGYFRGILRELLTVGVLLGTWFGSIPLAERIGAWMRAAGLSSHNIPLLARVAAVIVLFLALSVLAQALDRMIGRNREGTVKPWNRRVGALAGLALGCVMGLFLASLGDGFVQAFPRRSGPLATAIRQSYARQQASRLGTAEHLRITQFLKTVRDPENLQKIGKEQEWEELLDDPESRRLLQQQRRASPDGAPDRSVPPEREADGQSSDAPRP